MAKFAGLGNKQQSAFNAAMNCGWGFIVAWGISVIFTDTFSGGASSNLGLFWLCSMIGAPASLLVFFFIRKPLFRRPETRLTMCVGACACVVTGTLLLTGSGFAPDALVQPLRAAGGIVSSLATGVYTVLWGCRYATLDMRHIERSAVSSLVLAFACYGIVIVLPAGIDVLFIVVLPILSTFFFGLSNRNAQEKVGDTSSINKIPAAFNIAGFIKLGIGVFGATTVISLFWSLAGEGSFGLPHAAFELSILSGTVVAAVLMWYTARFSRSLNLGTLYRWLLPLIAAAVAALFIPGSTGAVIACAFANAAQALLNVLTFTYFAELASVSEYPAHRIFGIGRFFQEFGFLVGMLAATFVTTFSQAGVSPGGALVVALAVLTALVMVSISVQGHLSFTLEEKNDLRTNTTEVGLATVDGLTKLSEHYGLTNRESEILTYLAKGYSLPYIRNELVISQSTIDTHVKHIYRKLNIHSREELLDLVYEKKR